jgi:hypothetical protein
MRIDNGEVFAMTQSRMHHRLEPSAGLEFIHPAQSPKDLLAYLLTLADAMDDLEILVEQSSEEQQAPVQKAAVAARGSKKHNAGSDIKFRGGRSRRGPVLLAIFLSRRAAQKHDGSQYSRKVFFENRVGLHYSHF